MQEKAINQAEQDLRLKEAELLRQQQIALMEAQREAQEKRMQEQQQPPGILQNHTDSVRILFRYLAEFHYFESRNLIFTSDFRYFSAL